MTAKKINIILLAILALGNVWISGNLFKAPMLWGICLFISAAGLFLSTIASKNLYGYIEIIIDIYLFVAILFIAPPLILKPYSLSIVITTLAKLLLLFCAGISFIQFRRKNSYLLILLSSLLFYCTLYTKTPLSIHPLGYIFVQFFIFVLFLQISNSIKLKNSISPSAESFSLSNAEIKKIIFNTIIFTFSALLIASAIHTKIPRLEKSPFKILKINAPIGDTVYEGIRESSDAEEITYAVQEGGYGGKTMSRFDEILKSGERDNISGLSPLKKENHTISQTTSPVPPEEKPIPEEKTELPDTRHTNLFIFLLLRSAQIAIYGFFAVLVFLFILFLYKKIQKNLLLKTAKKAPEQFIILLYTILLETVKSTGIKIAPHTTPEEHIDILAPESAETGTAIKNIVDIFQKARYSNIIISKKEAENFSTLYSCFLASFIKNLPIHKRAIARFVAVKTN